VAHSLLINELSTVGIGRLIAVGWRIYEGGGGVK
jgi:hypothetical protein